LDDAESSPRQSFDRQIPFEKWDKVMARALSRAQTAT